MISINLRVEAQSQLKRSPCDLAATDTQFPGLRDDRWYVVGFRALDSDKEEDASSRMVMLHDRGFWRSNSDQGEEPMAVEEAGYLVIGELDLLAFPTFRA